MGVKSTRFEYITGGLNQCGYWRYDWQLCNLDGKGNQMRDIHTIIIHCSATRPSWWALKSSDEKVEEIRRWHVEERGWSDIGYHYVIDRNGDIVEGRSIERTGAHARGYNKGSIGICLLGGHGSSAEDRFEDNFTNLQGESLKELIEELDVEYDIKDIIGHNQVSSKSCPGFEVPAWLNSVGLLY